MYIPSVYVYFQVRISCISISVFCICVRLYLCIVYCLCLCFLPMRMSTPISVSCMCIVSVFAYSISMRIICTVPVCLGLCALCLFSLSLCIVWLCALCVLSLSLSMGGSQRTWVGVRANILSVYKLNFGSLHEAYFETRGCEYGPPPYFRQNIRGIKTVNGMYFFENFTEICTIFGSPIQWRFASKNIVTPPPIRPRLGCI